MNKEEKELAKKILANFRSDKNKFLDYTSDEQVTISRWIVHKIINEAAFHDASSMNGPKHYLQTPEYPFTFFGEQEIKKDGYLQFRNSKFIIVIRDILTIIAFLLSLYLTWSKVFPQ